MLKTSVLSPALSSAQAGVELHCCPLALCPVCALTCGHRLPVLLKTRANKAMHQTLWGGRSAGASLPGRGENGKALLFNYLVMRISLAFGTGICRSHGSSDVLGWCSWLECNWPSPLLSSFLFFQSSFPSISLPTFSILEVMYFLSRNMVRLDGCQSHRKPGLIGSALPVSDFLDGFVCVWFIVVWAFLFVCCF